LCEAKRYAYIVEKLFCSSADVIARVRKCFTDDQLQTAGLLQECVMDWDGLAYLTDYFTADDMSDIACYFGTC